MLNFLMVILFLIGLLDLLPYDRYVTDVFMRHIIDIF
jgi:hypothetical protein